MLNLHKDGAVAAGLLSMAVSGVKRRGLPCASLAEEVEMFETG